MYETKYDLDVDGAIGFSDFVIFARDFGKEVPSTGGVNTPKLYWPDSVTDKIQRANLDGSNIEDLISTGLGDPNVIALDISGGKMYWTDWIMNKIQRANLDGSNVEDLVTGLGDPRGIALDISGGKMYWTDTRTHKIQRANLDGSNTEDLISTGLISPRCIALYFLPNR